MKYLILAHGKFHFWPFVLEYVAPLMALAWKRVKIVFPTPWTNQYSEIDY